MIVLPTWRPRWYHLYFLLAAFDVVTISVTLLLSHNILSSYTDSLSSHKSCAQRLGHLSDLTELAAQVNTPGKDVFHSLDTGMQADRLSAYVAEFESAVELARADVATHVGSSDAQRLLDVLDSISGSIHKIDYEAGAIFSLLDDGRPDAAARRMAIMDQYFARAIGQIAHVCREVRRIQSAQFEQEVEQASCLGRYEYIISGVVVVIVCVITCYGHKLSRQMAEAERHIADNEVGNNVALIIPPPHDSQHDSYIQRFLHAGEQRVLGIGRAAEGLRKDGTTFPIEDQDALERANLQKQAILDAASEVSIIATDPQGIITLFNRGAEKLLGYAASEMIGKQTPARFHLESEVAERGIELSRELGRDVQGFEVFIALPQQSGFEEREWTYIRNDGGRRTVHLAVTCVRDRAGRISGYLGVAIDITERKQAEVELQKLALVAAKTDNAVIVTDAAGKIEWVNEGFTTLTGYSLQEVIQKKPGAFLQGPATDQTTVMDIRNAMLEGRSYEGEIYNYAKDGRGYWLAVSITPIRDKCHAICGFIAVQMEITDRKQAEAELQQAKEVAESANRAKSQFLANMSHEIRTPMNGIIGMTDLALDTDLTAEQRDYLETVKMSADSLLTVINDVLDFSKIEAGKLEVESICFQPRQVLSTTMRALGVRAAQKGLELTWQVADEVPDQLTGDPHRLRQILVNLIGNSIKFTDRGGVDVQVGVTDHADQELCLQFQVSDTGIGIPEEKLVDIFDPFSQADTSITRTFGGTGLGLSISAKLIDLMHGRIWVESQVGNGSVFSFTAIFGNGPMAAGEADNNSCVTNAEDEHARNIAAHNTQPLKILLVEDNPVNQKVAMRFLRGKSHLVQLATNGWEAVAAAAQERFDIIFMDVQMPVMDGLSATAEIRQREQQHNRYTPIVALTAHAMTGDRERFLDAGMDEYVSKPIRREELFRAIDNLVFAAESHINHCAEKDTAKDNPAEEDPANPDGTRFDATDNDTAAGTFDLAAALELADGDDTLLLELAEHILSTTPSLMSELQEALHRQDSKAIVTTAHGLKGTLGQVSASEARAAAARLERLARTHDFEQLASGYKRLEHSIEQLQTALRSWLSQSF